jgi:hypothetical protein
VEPGYNTSSANSRPQAKCQQQLLWKLANRMALNILLWQNRRSRDAMTSTSVRAKPICRLAVLREFAFLTLFFALAWLEGFVVLALHKCFKPRNPSVGTNYVFNACRTAVQTQSRRTAQTCRVVASSRYKWLLHKAKETAKFTRATCVRITHVIAPARTHKDSTIAQEGVSPYQMPRR